MQRLIQRLPQHHESAAPAAPAVPAPAAAPAAPTAAEPHLILHAFTANNVIAGTILSWAYDLGAVSAVGNLNLTAIERAIAAYTVPDDLPEYRLHLLGGEPQFSLTIEPVGTQQFHHLPLFGI